MSKRTQERVTRMRILGEGANIREVSKPHQPQVETFFSTYLSCGGELSQQTACVCSCPQTHVTTCMGTDTSPFGHGRTLLKSVFLRARRPPHGAGQRHLRRTWSHCPRLAGACGGGRRASQAGAWHRKPDIILTHSSDEAGGGHHSSLSPSYLPGLRMLGTPFISSFLPGAQARGVGLEGGGRNTTHKPTAAQSFELRDCRRETALLGGAGEMC